MTSQALNSRTKIKKGGAAALTRAGDRGDDGDPDAEAESGFDRSGCSAKNLSLGLTVRSVCLSQASVPSPRAWLVTKFVPRGGMRRRGSTSVLSRSVSASITRSSHHPKSSALRAAWAQGSDDARSQTGQLTGLAEMVGSAIRYWGCSGVSAVGKEISGGSAESGWGFGVAGPIIRSVSHRPALDQLVKRAVRLLDLPPRKLFYLSPKELKFDSCGATTDAAAIAHIF